MKSMLFSDVKSFIKYIQKRSYILQAVTLILLIGFIARQEYINHKILNKIDHRYFNTTRSLQDIHGVEIETRQGRVIRLIPKQ